MIPTVNWGDESTFDFCFEGVERGSVVAVSTYMASEHGNRSDQKEWFMAGYNEMLRRIEPEKIICYNIPFPEMQGDIVYADYERSSWRYMNYEHSDRKEDWDSFKIGGQISTSYDTISPFIDIPLKGGGSAYGGQWKPNPNKPNDAIYFGPANTTQRVFISTQKGGYWATIKYDSAGRAILIRHETVHAPNGVHSNPHDHVVQWIPPTFYPKPGPPINYFDGNVPDLKSYQKRGSVYMNPNYDPEVYRFKTINEFKTCMRQGGEVVIEWREKEYGIWSEGEHIRITSSDGLKAAQIYKTADEALTYMVGDDCLRDIITQVTVIERTI